MCINVRVQLMVSLVAIAFARFNDNDLTGTMPNEVCSLEPNPLVADCAIPAEVECVCCTDCV